MLAAAKFTEFMRGREIAAIIREESAVFLCVSGIRGDLTKRNRFSNNGRPGNEGLPQESPTSRGLRRFSLAPDFDLSVFFAGREGEFIA